MHRAVPFHPLTIAIENGERTYAWDCPSGCHQPLDCATINHLRYHIHDLGHLPCGDYRVMAHLHGAVFTLPNGDLVAALDGAPSGCQNCGIEKRDHGRQWTTAAGWHPWSAPTPAQIKLRMLARRHARTEAQAA